MEQPYSHAAAGVLHLTQETMWTPEEKLAQLEKITVESLQSYITAMLERTHLEILVHGNLLKDVSISFAKFIEDSNRS